MEPPRTQFDINFEIAGIPVRVHPFFWLGTVLLGLNLDTWMLPIWIAVVFLSILVHEFGHALAARACGWPPRVVLHGMGGLALYQPTYHQPSRQIGILAAGPGAGFLLAGILAILMLAIGKHVPFVGPLTIGRGEPVANLNLAVLLFFLFQVNILWGLINLLPIFPLDGGQIARELWCTKLNDEVAGTRKTLVFSIMVAVISAVVSYYFSRRWFMPIFFGVFAYINYQALQQLDRGYGGGGGGDYGRGGGRDYGGGYDDDRGGRGW